ncbi:hypothetical protein [Sphaerospermopsis sp. LEGE 08334]|nr:hypothetical protein [Sphaerospermopsis sp. LEGE 08334]
MNHAYIHHSFLGEGTGNREQGTGNREQVREKRYYKQLAGHDLKSKI